MPRKNVGSVSLTKEGVWRARVTIDGKRVELGRFETEAEGWRAVAGALSCIGSPKSDATVRSWGVEFLRDRELDKVHRGIRQDRVRWDGRIASQTWALVPMKSVQPRELRRWVDAMVREGLARSTISNALNLLRVGLEAAVVAGHLDENPARGIRVPKIAVRKDTWTVMTLDEIERVTTGTVLTEEQRIFYAVAIYTGCRPGELYGLRWADVHVDKLEPRPRIVIRSNRDDATKTGKVREVPLLPQALGALRRLSKMRKGLPLALVWPKVTGEEIGDTRAEGDDFGWAERTQRDRRRDTWTTYLGHRWFAGVRRSVRLYDMRHTCASHLISGSWGRAWSLAEVKEMLGHETMRTTERYAHFAPDALHAAAKATTLTRKR